jgi:hypothetical protein
MYDVKIKIKQKEKTFFILGEDLGKNKVPNSKREEAIRYFY